MRAPAESPGLALGQLALVPPPRGPDPSPCGPPLKGGRARARERESTGEERRGN